MPNNDIQELYQELKNTQSTSAKYAPFLQAMDVLDVEMRELMEPDENGWKLLTPERFQSFSQKYRDAGIKLEQYLSNTASTQDPAELAVREKAKALSEMMSRDAAVFRRYNPSVPGNQKSLPTLLEESRTPVIDISSTNLNSVGGAQSSRLPMTFVDQDGRPVSGVFTKASYYDPMANFNKAVSRATREQGISPQGTALLNNFMSAYKTYYTEHPDPKKPVGTAPDMLDNFFRNCMKNPKGSGWKMSTDKIAAEIAAVNGLTSLEVKQAIGKKALDTLASGMRSMAFETYINNAEVGMIDKARIDTKNAGMSIVAELLGCPKVVCRAKPMKIRDGKGNLIEGTFMEMAKGIDPNSPGKEGQRIGATSLKKAAPEGLEAIADLQVLDYLCGNVDRHGGNLFYQFDDRGRLIGVQGIDNDSSFGTYVPQLGKDAVRRLPVAPNMGVISKKTADIILNTSPAELAFALRGTIDEPSIKACCDRLNVMKHVINLSREKLNQNTREIKYPFLRELTTQEFGETDIEQLTDKKHNNHFRECNERMAWFGMSNSIGGPISAKMVGSENRATQAGLYGQFNVADQMSRKLKEKTSFFRGSSSQNYKDIEEAVREYKRLQNRILNRIINSEAKKANGDASPDVVFGQYVTALDISKMRQGLLKIKTAANKYAVEKRAEVARNGKTPEDDQYIKDRIDLAEEISAYVDKHLELTEDEKATLESNDRRSMEDYVRGQKSAADNELNINADNAVPKNINGNGHEPEGPVQGLV